MAHLARSAAPAMLLLLTFVVAPVATPSHAQATAIEKVTQPVPSTQRITVRSTGRTQRTADAMYIYQWPGVYFTADYKGAALFFRSGPGKQHLHLLVDGKPSDTVLDAAPATYRIPTPGSGEHHVRIDVVNENQDSPKSLGAFSVETGSSKDPGILDPLSRRQVEFIGDSHTVGYGNTSSTHDCTPDVVWSTTDTTESPGALTAAHFHADYQLLASSGRGVVRNYNGTSNPTVPEAYPFVLFDRQQRANDPTWKPSVIVISLGTNDFSTELHAGEPWKTRDDLHAAFETTFVAFLRSLRASHPQALIVLWATDIFSGEIAAEDRKVVDTLRASGDKRISFVEVRKLAFSACHGHPNVADDQAIADKLAAAIEADKVAW